MRRFTGIHGRTERSFARRPVELGKYLPEGAPDEVDSGTTEELLSMGG